MKIHQTKIDGGGRVEQPTLSGDCEDVNVDKYCTLHNTFKIFFSSTPLIVVFDGLKNENWKKELFQSRIIDVYFHPEASNILGNFFYIGVYSLFH